MTSGTFTVSFWGYKKSDIAVDAEAKIIKTKLENLPSVNLVHVESISNGWIVTFFSMAGDLPLIQVTLGRLSISAKVVVTEATKGDSATHVYNGSEIPGQPGQQTFEALDLMPDTGYAFKVAPVNAV